MEDIYLIIFLVLIILGLGIIIYKKKFSENFSGTNIPTTTKITSGSLEFKDKSYLLVQKNNDFNLRGVSFTMEWFQYRTDNNANAYFFINDVIGLGEIKIRDNNIENGWLLKINKDIMKIYDSTPNNIKAPKNNTWNHIALSVLYLKPEQSFYNISINGNTIQKSFTSINNPTKNFAIGNLESPSRPGFEGYITDFRFTRGAALYSNPTYQVPSRPLQGIANNINSKLLLSPIQNAPFRNLGTTTYRITPYSVNFSSFNTSTNIPPTTTPIPKPTTTPTSTTTIPKQSRVIAWGNDNFYNQKDVPVTLNNNVTAISAGWNHSLAITNDKKIISWGSKEYGVADFPSDLNNVIAISAGKLHSLALTMNYTTGKTTVVPCGDNSLDQYTKLINLNNITAISAGHFHSLAITSDKMVIASGDNSYSQCSVPSDLKNVIAISAGLYHSLALTSDNGGTIRHWGKDSGLAPKDLKNVIAISAGEEFSLALTKEGNVTKVHAWGSKNEYKQQTIPTSLENANIIAIEAGWYNSFALVKEGTSVKIVAWGRNAVLAPKLNNFSAISSGGTHTIAIEMI